MDERYTEVVNVHVVSIPSNADVALLYDLFAPYGRVISAEIGEIAAALDPTGGGMYTRNGTVQIEGLESAHLALRALNGAILFEGLRPLIVRITSSYNPRRLIN